MKPENRLKLDQFIARPPMVAWRALTDPELLARWWASGDIKPVVGHRFSMDLGPWGIQRCEVLEVEEPVLLSYTFAEGLLNTKITWRLVAEGIGTRLFVEHRDFDLDSPQGRQAFKGMGDGWPSVLTRIEGALA